MKEMDVYKVVKEIPKDKNIISTKMGFQLEEV